MQGHVTSQLPPNPHQTMTSQHALHMASETTAGVTAHDLGYGDSNRKLYTDAELDREFGEEVDEDFTDEECQFSFENFVQKKAEAVASENRDCGTGKLLAFLELVNTDIQKYFGRNKGNEDACDVYQDKWTSGKSGRELYYADLMKIAQGLDTDDPKSPPKSDCALKELKNGGKQNTEVYSGKLDLSRGLGPFEGLFEQGLQPGGTAASKKGATAKHAHNHGKRAKRGRADDVNVKRSKTLPMTERKLPSSFWSEPKQQKELLQVRSDCSQEMVATVGNNNNNALIDSEMKCSKRALVSQVGGVEGLVNQPTAPPDFGDLLDCWGDVTHMSSSCPPGGHNTHHTVTHRGSTLAPTAGP